MEDEMKNILIILLLVTIASPCDAIEIVVSDAVLSDYITKSGSRIGQGPVNQSSLSIVMWGWYGKICNNHDFGLNKTTEIDLIAGKRMYIDSSVGKFSFDLSFQRWLEEKDNENILEVVAKHKGGLDVTAVWTKQISDGVGFDKNRLYLEIEKSLPVGKLVLIPSLATAYINNFYGGHGWPQVTARLRAEYEINKHVSFFAQVNGQKGLLPKKDDLIYGGGGVRMYF